MMPMTADALARADAHRRAGRLPQAEALYRDWLRGTPDDADTWCLLGAACRDQQRFPEAVDAYRKALDLQPDRPHALNGLGIVYACWRRFADAEVWFRKALDLQPDYAKALNNLGNALSEQRKLDEAAAAYRRARELGYGDAGLDDSLGQVLARKGELEEAAACYRRALDSRPGDSGLLTRLAVVLARQGQLDDAIDAMRRALRLPAATADVYFKMGDALNDKGKLDLAVTCFERALAERPNEPTILNHLATAQLQQGRLDAAAANFRRAFAVRPGDLWSRSSLLFVRTNDPAAEPEDVFEEHCTWARLHAPTVTPGAYAPGSPDKVLRVGYVSPDFRRHPVGRFMESVLAAHDPKRVEVFCYDEAVRNPDEVTDRLRAAARHWRVTKEKSDAQVADMVRADKIDVLIDLAGHTGHNRLGVFALRPAPVQVTYLGYPNTTGVSGIDYVLVDAITQPATEMAWFVEEPVRLAGDFCCYAPRDDAPPPGPLPAKRSGHVTFGAFHNLSKLNGRVLELWAKVLAAVPGSKLLIGRNTLSGDTTAELRRKLVAAGIAEDRFELRALVAGPAAFLEAYLPVDISLDPFPWSGHTTACDSLWMGVPVISLRGKTHAGRMVASVLTHVGLPDWIAETPEQYVQIAAKWASDIDGLAGLRDGLRERMRASKLCDATGFTGHLEDAYRRMWQRWCARGPEPVTVPDLMQRADALRQNNRTPQAEDMYRLAVRRDPNYVEAWAWLGTVCHTMGRLEEAVGNYRRAAYLRPQDPRTHNSLGIVLAKLLRYADAEASFRQAIDLYPEYAKAHNNLGNVLSEQGKLDEAAAAFRAADAHGYRDPTLLCNLAIVYSRQGFLDRALATFNDALKLDPRNDTAQSALLFMRNYDPATTIEESFEAHRSWGAGRVANVTPIAHAPPADAGGSLGRVLRVGYVSPDFRNHPVGRFIEPVLAAHAPGRVQVVCYDEAPYPPDPVTNRLRSLAPTWRVTKGQTDAQVVEQIRADRIDILVDLAGHTAHNRLAAFARKPAPVQVTYLGYPNTTGLPTIDYILVDPITLPEGDPGRFVETPFRLPGCFSCFAGPENVAVAPLPAPRKGYVTFGSTHGLIKLNAAVLDLWAAVLKAVPGSRLRIARDMLGGEARAYFRRQFVDRGIPADRVELVQPPVGAAAYWPLYHDIDIALDTFPWSGHTTACEALWLGVPTVTLRGRMHAGRMVASVLTHTGLTDWIAGTPEEYIAVALKWATDLDGLAALRAELRDRLRASALCDAARFTRQLEDAYRAMWRGVR